MSAATGPPVSLKMTEVVSHTPSPKEIRLSNYFRQYCSDVWPLSIAETDIWSEASSERNSFGPFT